MNALRRVKEEVGIDLTGKDTDVMLAFATDPFTVAEVCYALYKPQINEKMTEEQFMEELDCDAIDALREEVIRQMRGFSKFWKILSTQMEDLQSGNLSQDMLEAVKEKIRDPSGPSGSPPEPSLATTLET